MLKNERLVYAMSPQERIKLITGIGFRNRRLDGYAFPVFEFSPEPTVGRDKRLTAFPSYNALACAFNPDIVRRVYKCMGNEIKASVPNAYTSVTNEACGNTVTDPYLTKSLIEAKINGLSETGAYVNFDDRASVSDSERVIADHKLITDALSGSDPSSVLVYSPDGLNSLAEYKYKGLKYGYAATKEDVAKYLLGGCSFVYLESDFTEELIPYLLELTVHYAKGEDACRRGKISRERLEACCSELKMLPMELIDRACDDFISVLVGLTVANPDSVAEPKTALSSDEPLFDEKYHNDIALEAARQCVVMIKNDGILPLKHELKVAVVGECANNEEYCCYGGNRPTQSGMPFNVINDYDIKTVGYAYGYNKGETRPDLVATARSLCAGADVILLYLCAEPGAKTLPPEQLEALRALSYTDKKIVAIAEADGELDMSFESKCNAVLFVARGGQCAAAAEFEIITGSVNPSARLAFSIRKDVTDPDSPISYPFGYGLSYNKYEYSNLAVTDAGITFTVKNTGETDGYSTTAMYVGKIVGDTVEEYKLRGLGKVFVKRNDASKVEIAFGAETFRTYSSSRGKFVNEGGDYAITVCDSAANSALAGDITLSEHIFNEVRESSTVSGEGEQQLLDFGSGKQSYEETNKNMGYGGKIALAVFMALYACASAVLLIVSGVVNNLLGYIILGVVAVAVTLATIIYCAKLTGRYNELKRDISPKYVGELVERLAPFKELATVVYEHPVVPDVPDIFEQEDEDEEEETRVITYEYTNELTQSSPEKIKFRENPTFNEICTNFREFALSYGVDVEVVSLRALFGAMAASKLVLLDIKNKEALPLFTQAFCEYMGNVTPIEAGWAWDKPSDLYWTLEDGKYVPSAFTNAVTAAINTPDKNSVAVITNVVPSQLKDYFADILKYALYPSEEHTLRLNDEMHIKLPRNICYVLVLADSAEIPPKVAAASVQAELLISKTEPAVKPEIKHVSYTSYVDLVKEARENYYLPEAYWKKIDDLIKVLNATEPFTVGNKSIHQIERLTSVIMASGGEASEALVAAFVSKLTAMLKNLDIYKQDNGEKAIYGVISKLFPEENTTKIQKALLKTATSGGGR